MRFHHLTAAAAATAALALALAACGGDSGAGGTAGDHFITIGITFDQPGLGLKDGSNYTGFDVEVARYVARDLGFEGDKVKFLESPSAQPETLIQSGQVRLSFVTSSISDDRSEKISYAGPYFVAGQDLLVRADSTDITGPDSLNGKKLCSVNASTSAKKIKDSYSSSVQLREYDTYATCVEALSAGTIDAVTADNLILAGYASQSQYQGKLKVVGKPFSSENYGVGLKKGDATLCGQVNTSIEKMISDGSWQKALDATVGPSGFRPDTKTNPPKTAACS